MGDDRLPVAMLEDGTVLERPTVLELAERLGVAGQPALEHYDLVIVGGGPAGLAAAVYGASEGLKTLMVEEGPGGQAGQSSRIENYLGFPAGLSGSELTQRATTQARRLGAELLTLQDTTGLRAEGSGRIVELSGGGNLSASTVLIASGVSYRQLNAPGFAELTGQGIYYGAALTDAREGEDQHVVVIGGANSAGQAAVYLSSHASRVTMLVRGDSLEKSMSHYLIEQIEGLDNVEVRTRSEAVAAEGDGRLRALRIRNPDGTLLTFLSSPLPLISTFIPLLACPGCSSPATSARARSSGWRAQSARARWRSRSYTNTWPRHESGGRGTGHRRRPQAGRPVRRPRRHRARRVGGGRRTARRRGRGRRP